jgi:hypothetical protein
MGIFYFTKELDSHNENSWFWTDSSSTTFGVPAAWLLRIYNSTYENPNPKGLKTYSSVSTQLQYYFLWPGFILDFLLYSTIVSLLTMLSYSDRSRTIWRGD